MQKPTECSLRAWFFVGVCLLLMVRVRRLVGRLTASGLQFAHVPGLVGVGWAVDVVNQGDVP